MAWHYSTCCSFLHVYHSSGNNVHCAVAFSLCCGIVHCAAVFFFVPQYFSSCCSNFFAPKARKEENFVHGSRGNVSHCHELHWWYYQSQGWFYIIATRSLTKQKTINLCGVWHRPWHQWHDALLLYHWHYNIGGWSCSVFCSGSKTEESFHYCKVQWQCWWLGHKNELGLVLAAACSGRSKFLKENHHRQWSCATAMQHCFCSAGKKCAS